MDLLFRESRKLFFFFLLAVFWKAFAAAGRPRSGAGGGEGGRQQAWRPSLAPPQPGGDSSAQSRTPCLPGDMLPGLIGAELVNNVCEMFLPEEGSRGAGPRCLAGCVRLAEGRRVSFSPWQRRRAAACAWLPGGETCPQKKTPEDP